MKTRKETRLTVVDERGRMYERYNIKIEESIQDNGRTLKLFVSAADAKLPKGFKKGKCKCGNSYGYCGVDIGYCVECIDSMEATN